MSSDHRNALPVGYQLQEYRIESVLGHGGFGITYLSKDIHLEQWVAIKEYLPNACAVREGVSTVYAKCSEDEEAFKWGLQRFILEARTLAHFRHPNIVRVLRFFEENRTAYMVMEYQEGESLDHILKEQGTLDEKHLLEVLLPILDGLEQVHAAGFLHRDIKPNNIFVGKDGTPVLLDFGAARYAMSQKSSDLTSIVSPGYAPLEQYDRNSEQGAWTDIYALGALAYHALSGKPPQEVVGRMKHDTLPRAVELGRGRYREQILRGIDWALALDETARPQSIAEWREALLAPPLELMPKAAQTVDAPQKYFSAPILLFVGFLVAVSGGSVLYQKLTGTPPAPQPIYMPVGSAPFEQARLLAFIQSFFDANRKTDVEALLAHYAENVDYLGWGLVPADMIRRDKVEFFQRWPEIHYELLGDVKFLDTPAQDEQVVEFVFSYEVRNPTLKEADNSVKSKQGESKYLWRLKTGANGLKITVHKEKVLR